MSLDRRAAVVGLAVGVVHAAAVAGLVRWLDYPIDALANAPAGQFETLLG